MFGENRVLSLQSHVVHGYVGNKAATFPLQLLGFDVDPLNSVNLSTHNGYRAVKGIVLEKKDIDLLFNGLEENGLLSMYSHVLTGYIGSVTFLEKITDIVETLRILQARRSTCSSNVDGKVTDGSRGATTYTSASPPIYVCDPVLGDEGRFYVSPDLIPIYRAKILPLVTILTPNQFEAEALTDMKITDIPSACESMRKLHDMGVRTVIITSSSLTGADLLRSECCDGSVVHASMPCGKCGNEGSTIAGDSVCERDTMLLLASCPISDVEDQISDPNGIFHYLFDVPPSERPTHVQFAIGVPKIVDDAGELISFTGTGDMTAALLLAQATKYPKDLVKATELVLRTIHAVCLRTAVAFKEHHRKLSAAHRIIAQEIARTTTDSKGTADDENDLQNASKADSPVDISSASVASSDGNSCHPEKEDIMSLNEAKFYIEFSRSIDTRTNVHASQAHDAFNNILTYKSDVEALTNNRSPVPSFLELKLVQSKADIESPPDFGFRAVRVHCEANHPKSS